MVVDCISLSAFPGDETDESASTHFRVGVWILKYWFEICVFGLSRMGSGLRLCEMGNEFGTDEEDQSGE